jgi:hypothetical protein
MAYTRCVIARSFLPLVPLLLLAAAPTAASELSVSVEIPALQVAEYHRPYVAVWVENDRERHQANLALWFDHDAANNEGSKWLKDLRQWWRRSGRNLGFPADGFTGATRPAGHHQIRFNGSHKALAQLPSGSYQLVIEAAREVGGRELVKLPFNWPIVQESRSRAQGSDELGLIELSLKP